MTGHCKSIVRGPKSNVMGFYEWYKRAMGLLNQMYKIKEKKKKRLKGIVRALYGNCKELECNKGTTEKKKKKQTFIG